MASPFTAHRVAFALTLLVLLVACSRDGTPAQPRSAAGDQDGGPRQVKSVIVAVKGSIHAMSIAGDLTTSGGWQSVNELHANGLVTAGVDSRAPVPRLAERVPSFDDGTLRLLPDGRMQVAYPLRQGVTWQDGAPFTSRDLLFSSQLQMDEGLPVMDRKLGRQLLHSAEAPDDHTFVFYFTGPYYRADSLGPRLFWIHPQHILQPAHQRYLASGDANELLQVPYWTTEYVHLGPFRLVAIVPGEELRFEAYEGHFLGRPKIDLVYVRTFHSESALFASLLAGAVDVFMDGTLSTELGNQLRERWERAGQGIIYGKLDSSRLLDLQWRAAFQSEPANLEPRVRAALYYAIDRPALASALQLGRSELAATSVLPPSERPYPATKDGLLQYHYDPGRARAILQESGWVPRSDGSLRHAGDGRRYRTTLWADSNSDNETMRPPLAAPARDLLAY